jgi:hypothetical protein
MFRARGVGSRVRVESSRVMLCSCGNNAWLHDTETPRNVRSERCRRAR